MFPPPSPVALRKADPFWSAIKGEGVQELPSPKDVAVNPAQARRFTGHVPLPLNRLDLMVHDADRILMSEQKNGRCGNAGRNLATPVTTGNQHRLRSLLSGTRLGANIVGGGQSQTMAVPKRSMISGVIVGIAAQDVEDDSAEQLTQCLPGFHKTMADNFSQLLVAGICGHHLIELQHRQRGNHRAPPPVSAMPDTVKALDQDRKS